MKDLSPVYKLRKGLLTSGIDLEIEFQFGLIYLDQGEYLVEVFFDEELSLINIDKENQELFREPLNLSCITEEGKILKAERLLMKNLLYAMPKGIFHCWGHIYIEEVKREPFSLKSIANDEVEESPDILHYLKLEGLKMRFSDSSETTVQRGNKTLHKYQLGLPTWDHSEVYIAHNNKQYFCVFTLDEDAETIIVEFQRPYAQYLSLHFEDYREFKDDFVALLSFLNGAEVKVRAEYTGSYTKGAKSYADADKHLKNKPQKFDAHKKYLFSFPTIENKRHNKFIPLCEGSNRQENIISQVFSNNFDLYRERNKELDLNSIIYYLCDAEQSVSMEERVFIQTIALERLSHHYIQTLDKKEETILSNEDNEKVKSELEEVLKNNKQLFGDKYNDVKARILNFNYVKRARTDVKMRTLIKGIGIEVTPSIEKLIGIVRNSVIHYGDIAADGEAFKNYVLMDELIRQIIIVLIEYKGFYLDVVKRYSLETEEE